MPTQVRRHPRTVIGVDQRPQLLPDRSIGRPGPAVGLQPVGPAAFQPCPERRPAQAAARYLHEADMPLVYGMSNTTCEAQKECVALADQLGGLLDSHTSL